MTKEVCLHVPFFCESGLSHVERRLMSTVYTLPVLQKTLKISYDESGWRSRSTRNILWLGILSTGRKGASDGVSISALKATGQTQRTSLLNGLHHQLSQLR